VDWFDLLVEEHERDPFDVFHAYFLTQAGFIAALAGRYLSVPSVISIRGNDLDRAAFDPARFSHTMFALQHASVVTANATESIRKANAFIDREIILIPNGVDVGHFKPMDKNMALAESLGITVNVILSDEGAKNLHPAAEDDGSVFPIIGFVGELREKKGMRTLLSACAQLNKKQPTALLIVGEIRAGEDKHAFDEFLSSHPDSKIIVTGYIPPADLPAYYSLIDVFVHPSLHDGMPNAVLEAMACGKAVVATPVGGIPDLLEEGKNGRLVKVSDVHGLSETVLELLRSPELRARLGESARAVVVQKFSPEKELEANLEIYRRLGIQQ
jgi:glycosyltransferase involved in cell wall biosynthesis